MSEIQVGQINSTDGSTAITTGADGYVSFAKTQIGGRRNLIINGAMQVAQRGTSQSITYSTLFPVDRFEMGFGAHAQLAGTVSQSTTAPNGFANSVKLDITTAETALDSGEGITLRQKFEGQDLQQLAKGTADAKQVTLSFWVRSSQTGTYVAELYDNDNVRQISKSYTIDTANTWEYKTITFPADTTGAFDNDNNLSLYVFWWLAAGSAFTSGTLNDDAWAAATNADRAVGQTNLISSVNDWYITGVQLEVGSVATPFEHRSYGEELALCQRYYYRMTCSGNTNDIAFIGYNNLTTQGQYALQFPVTLRTAPTDLEYYDTKTSPPALDAWEVRALGNRVAEDIVWIASSRTNMYFRCDVTSGLTSGYSCALRSKTSDAFLAVDVEL